jgi:outer membrane biosynthesis protein TonB
MPRANSVIMTASTVATALPRRAVRAGFRAARLPLAMAEHLTERAGVDISGLPPVIVLDTLEAQTKQAIGRLLGDGMLVAEGERQARLVAHRRGLVLIDEESVAAGEPPAPPAPIAVVPDPEPVPVPEPEREPEPEPEAQPGPEGGAEAQDSEEAAAARLAEIRRAEEAARQEAAERAAVRREAQRKAAAARAKAAAAKRRRAQVTGD